MSKRDAPFVINKSDFIFKFIFYYFAGDIVLFEIFSNNLNSYSEVKLESIKKLFTNPLNEAKYKLLGVVTYKRPVSTRTIQSIGHYTALCLRVGQTWLEYNDLEKKEKHIKESSLITPALLIYSI